MNWPADILFLISMASAVVRFPADAGLAARLKGRDPDAMADLYDRYGRIVYSLILRITGNRAVAEELAQETFLRVWNRAASFEAERGPLGPWVLAVARNQALDYVRSLEGKASRNSVEPGDVVLSQLSKSVESDIMDGIQLERVRVALARLDENQRLVIELAYFEGLSQTEMAERIRQPLGTVKTWVRAALKSLRDELGATPV